MGSPPLRAGAASVNVDPPFGVDLVGYLKRWRPADSWGQPLEVNVLVAELGGRWLALVALDAPSVVDAYARRMRERIAAVLGCAVDEVLINASHTHCAPPLPGHLKTGGSTALTRPEEDRYAEFLIDRAVNAATMALRDLAPARVGHGADTFERGVNRRQRTPDGDTIIGWNPVAARDTEVSVIRVDALDGRHIATAVVYACHPCVLGPEITASSSDFVGSLRESVRATTGGVCLFLQGAAGNIFPLEAVHETQGAEAVFGAALARAALRAFDRAEPTLFQPVQTPFRSAAKAAVWRLEPAAEQRPATLRSLSAPVRLPLQPVPSAERMRELGDELESTLRGLRAAGPRDDWNAVWLHVEWARRMAERLAAGPHPGVVDTRVHAGVLGEVLLIALPCEPFCEIGLEIKSAFPGPTVVLGYTNDMVGYIPTAEEFPLGGYEPHFANRHFDQPAPYDPGVAAVLTAAAVEAGRAVLRQAAADSTEGSSDA